MKVLIFVEHDKRKVIEATAKLADAALKLNPDGYDAIIFVEEKSQHIALQTAKLNGANKVFVAQNKLFKGNIAENIEKNILSIAKQYDAIIAIANMNGKNFMPKIAAKLDVMQISDVIEIIDQNTFKRPIYAGNAIQTVRSKDHIKVITIRETSFNPVERNGSATIEYIDETQIAKNMVKNITLCSEEVSQLERPELTSADIVISGGRGLQKKENFKMIEDIAQKLNAAVGASRAAVDAGFVTNDYQVGQTGKVVAPKLYIAVGISGAIQHLAGMKDSKIIVAINKDEEAPIFQVADYGLVDDLFNALPILKQKL